MKFSPGSRPVLHSSCKKNRIRKIIYHYQVSHLHLVSQLAKCGCGWEWALEEHLSNKVEIDMKCYRTRPLVDRNWRSEDMQREREREMLVCMFWWEPVEQSTDYGTLYHDHPHEGHPCSFGSCKGLYGRRVDLTLSEASRWSSVLGPLN